LTKNIEKGMYAKDSITEKMIEILGNIDNYNKFKYTCSNKKLSDLVLNRGTFEPIVKTNVKLIRKIEPIYQEPSSKWGRSQFYSVYKSIFNWQFNTLFFNLTIIWLMSFIIFILIYMIFIKKFK